MRPRATILPVLVFALASCAVVAQAQAPAAAPKPGPEIKKLGVMVGKFANEGEMKAGAMGPNSPVQKVTGTDDCRWTSGGFGVLCNSTVDIGGMKGTEVALAYYDPTSKTYHYHSVDSAGDIDDSTGTVEGNTWTWIGQSIEGGHAMHSRFIMKVISKDSFEYTVESGDSESSMVPVMSGKETRVVAAAKPPMSKPASQ
ncbi:MAG TPA: DUF1579 family protein [Candidatus Acidoferrum sp.]|nr:DUF1579 family protein [Candidatus Acidoferrum sp.]